MNLYDEKGERRFSSDQLDLDLIEQLLYHDEEEAETEAGDLDCALCPSAFNNPYSLIHHLLTIHIPNDSAPGPSRQSIASGRSRDPLKFSASNGWHARFTKRHDLSNVIMTGEKGSNTEEAAEKFKMSFVLHTARGYTPKEPLR